MKAKEWILITMVMVSVSAMADKARVDVNYDPAEPGQMAMTLRVNGNPIGSILVGAPSINAISGLGLEYYRASNEPGRMTREDGQTAYWCQETGKNYVAGPDGQIRAMFTGLGIEKRRAPDGSPLPIDVRIDDTLYCRIMPGVIVGDQLYLVNTGIVETYLNGRPLAMRESPDPTQPGDSYWLKLAEANQPPPPPPIVQPPAPTANTTTARVAMVASIPRAECIFTINGTGTIVEIDPKGNNLATIFDGVGSSTITGIGVLYEASKDAWIAPVPDYWPAYINFSRSFGQRTTLTTIVQLSDGSICRAKAGRWNSSWVIKPLNINPIETAPEAVTPAQPTPEIEATPETENVPPLSPPPAENP